MVSVPECNDILSSCIQEIHVMQVGLFLGLIIYLFTAKHPVAGSLVASVAIVSVIAFDIHGIRKPWYALAGIIAGVVLGHVIDFGVRRLRG